MHVASFSRKNMGRHLGLREKLLRPGIGLGGDRQADQRPRAPPAWESEGQPQVALDDEAARGTLYAFADQHCD